MTRRLMTRRLVATAVLVTAAGFAPLHAQGPAANLVQNADLEAGLAAGQTLPPGWSRFGKADTAYSGTVQPGGRFGGNAVRVQCGQDYAGVNSTRVKLDPTRRYAARAWVKVEPNAKGSAWIKLDYTDSTGKWLGDSKSGVAVRPGPMEWQLASIVVPGDLYPGAAQISLAVGCGTETVAWFDDLELVAREPGPPGNLLADGGMEWVVGERQSKWGISQAPGGTVQRFRRSVPVREGWYSMQLVGKAQWVASDSPPLPLDRTKKYTLTGWIRARVGRGTIKINYLKDGKYLAQTDSPPVTANTWTQVRVEAQLDKYPEATHLGVGCFSSGGDCDVLYDDLVFRAE
jgi:hypothetical protein